MTRLTTTTRESLVLRQRASIPLAHSPAEPFVRAGMTGSGDALLVLRWTAADLARERAAGARTLRSFGVRPGMRVANTLAGALASPGSLLLGDVVEELGGLDVPLGFTSNETASKPAWELLDRVQPDVVVVDAGSATSLFACAPAQARPWLQGIIWLRTGSAPERIDIPANLGFSGWQRSWLAVPELSCFVAAQCAAGSFHLDSELEGEVDDGQLILSMPKFPAAPACYASGVRARRLPSCPCGKDGMALQLE